MCWSNAALFFGLCSTTASLNFAASAYQSTRAPLLTIDLILARQSAGKLLVANAAEQRASVSDLTRENWQLVKQHLRDMEVREAELEALAQIRCDDCKRDDVRTVKHLARNSEGAGEDLLQRKHRWDRWGPIEHECDMCYDNLDNVELDQRTPQQLEVSRAARRCCLESFISAEPVRSLTQNITALLTHYSLELTSPAMLHSDPSTAWRSFDSLSSICLPLRSTDTSLKKYPIVKAEAAHDYGSGSAVVNFSEEALKAADQPGVNRRFVQLVEEWGLVVVDRSAEVKEEKKKGKGKKKKVVVEDRAKEEGKSKGKGKVEPRWILWALCEPCA